MLCIVPTNLFLARGGATQQVTFCGMLDLDRVEMILPQVHLRNGDIELRKQYICRQTPSASYCASKWLSSAEFLPRLPPLDSAFAGDGLNIRRYTQYNTPTLTVSERSPNREVLRCGLPIVPSKTLLPSERALPPLLHPCSHRSRGSLWL